MQVRGGMRALSDLLDGAERARGSTRGGVDESRCDAAVCDAVVVEVAIVERNAAGGFAHGCGCVVMPTCAQNPSFERWRRYSAIEPSGMVEAWRKRAREASRRARPRGPIGAVLSARAGVSIDVV